MFEPVVSINYVLRNNGTWMSGDFLKDKYERHWIGDFKTGKAVRVKALDVGRYKYKKLLVKSDNMMRKLADNNIEF